MNETRTNTRVKEIAMSYQSFLKSNSNSSPSMAGLQTGSVPRKAPANYSPMPSNSFSSYRSVSQPGVRTPSLSGPSTPRTGSVYTPPTPTSIRSEPPAAAPPAVSVTYTGTLTQIEVDNALGKCLEVLKDAVTNHEKRPFSAILLGPDNATILHTHFSISHVQHAESELARLASIQYTQTFLAKCTLVSTWEPCAMCAGTIYWTGIGRVLYAASETKLKDLTGPNNNENMTMDLPCRTVFQSGQRQVEVIGPVSSWEEKVVHESGKWWKEHKSNGIKNGSISSLGRGSALGSIHNGSFVAPQEDIILSSIGEDGEYQADLKVDWMR